jgi:uncharacterized BrkB/YihY/UPF0761 family membrane protein
MMIFYLGYLLPLFLLLFLVVFFEEEAKTVKDLLDYWWVFLTPFFNIFFIISWLFTALYEFLEKRVDFSFIKRYWGKFINIKLKKL